MPTTLPCVEEPHLLLIMLVTGISCFFVGYLIAEFRREPWE